ncbi:MAG: glycoside hydrolase family 3 C-terminal domain-containing protein [Lachnospiraceae bacterium]|nr:glycoside hydrolase family 3 C-terminal domain-containing protein [Lachnospiraceae bacterium]
MNFTLDYEKFAMLARTAAAEGCVLLRNEDHVLPAKKGERISVFGRIQFTYYKSGTGSGGMVNAPYVVSISDGLKACKEIRLNEELEQVYREWIAENPFDMGQGWAKEPWSQREMPVSRELAEKAAAESDMAVIVLGRTAGEDQDNSAQPGSYLLTPEEEQLLEVVCSTFEKTAVVLNVGNIIDMKWVERYQPKAVLYAWQGGMEGGNGVADVLTGRVNPCGKLSDTIAEDITDYPSTANFGDPKCNCYKEDIYVGYRYFETFAKDRVLYPFGFGLSYTTFAIHAEAFTADADGAEISVRVKNTGDLAGKEVVQLYVCPPQGKLGKPLRSLVDFQKTRLLEPGEEETLTFQFRLATAASYDDSGVTGHKSCYVLEAGDYALFAGADVRSAACAGTVSVENLRVVEKLCEAMAPVQPCTRLRPEAGADGQMVPAWEDMPLRTIDLAGRIEAELPEETEYTGDKGCRFSDVYDGRVSLSDFLAQLSDEDLICMTRGEGMCSPKVTPGTAAAFGGVTSRLQEFEIPTACCADGPSGIRMDCGTSAFSMPNGTLLACTFDTALTEALYEMEGRELRKNRIDTLLGPGINIHRNPLNGRNFEYFSEDPCLTGKLAAAQLRGMAKFGVTGTLKHFACNNQEYKRHDANGVISERALREIYLKGFEIAVKEGGAYSIMSTYGPVNGLWTAGNYDLLTTILRKEWKFDGVVMTDWWAKMNEEGGEGSKNNTIPMVRAQNDVYMVVSDSSKNSAGDNTMEGLRTGRLTRGQLVRNAANICRFLLKSPVTSRFLNREQDCCQESGHFVDCSKPETPIQEIAVEPGRTYCLDAANLSTQKGTSAVYRVTFSEIGVYQLSMRIKSDAGDLAQMPVTVFGNNHLLQTVTINGTNGEWVTKTVDLNVFNALDWHLKFYFGESGIEIGALEISRKAE